MPLPIEAEEARLLGGADDAGSEYGTQEEDEMMNEMISKHRSALQHFVGRVVIPDDGDDDDGHELTYDHEAISPRAVDNSSDAHNDIYGDLSASSFTTHQALSTTGQRLLELSQSEQDRQSAEKHRTDRMKLAELSVVRNEQIGRAAIMKWNPKAKVVRERDTSNRSPAVRVRSSAASPHEAAKVLGEYSKDFVQQALDFNGHSMLDDEDAAEDKDSPHLKLVSSLDSVGSDQHASQHELQTYVKHMEDTIAQLVQQKDELLRNQVEFDKHASGIFPSLEHLNNQLTQIVQGKMLNSQANIKDDVYDEIRLQREQLSELELEAKRRSHDAEVQDQSRAIEISQIKAQIVSLLTNSKLREEKAELLSDTVTKLQQELQENMKTVTQRYHLVEKRVTQLQTPIVQPRVPVRTTDSSFKPLLVATVVVAMFAVVACVWGVDNCGMLRRCHPLT